MSIHASLYRRLRDDAAVDSLVSGAIYPVNAPDTHSLAYICHRQIDPGAERHLSGYGPYHPRHEINCYASKYSVARATADAVIESLFAWPGANGVQSVRLVADSDQEFEIDSKTYCIMLVFEIWHS